MVSNRFLYSEGGAKRSNGSFGVEREETPTVSAVLGIIRK
jgi:hypothetical protein